MSFGTVFRPYYRPPPLPSPFATLTVALDSHEGCMIWTDLPPPGRVRLVTKTGRWFDYTVSQFLQPDLGEISVTWTEMPPVGRVVRYVSRGKWLDYTVLESDCGDAINAIYTGTAWTHYALHPNGKKPPYNAHLTIAEMPLPGDVDTQGRQQGQIFTFNPPRGRPPIKMRSMTGWMNSDNELSFSSRNFSLPPKGKLKVSYSGLTNHTLYENSFEISSAKENHVVPGGRNPYIDRHFAMQSNVLPEDSVEAFSRYVYEVPSSRERIDYRGMVAASVGPDADEVISHVSDAPPKSRDRARWIRDGMQSSDVAARDETGDLVYYRGNDAHTALCPARRNRNTYAGFTAPVPPDDVSQADAGYQWTAIPPRGRNRHADRYLGAQQRTDIDQRREAPVAGFASYDLPLLNAVHALKPSDYEGFTYPSVSQDFVPGTSSTWKPVIRPRRRR